MSSYLLVCLEDFVLFFGVSEIDFNLFRGLQMLGSFTRMILWGVGGDWAGPEAGAVPGTWTPWTPWPPCPPISLLSPLKLPSTMFNSFCRLSQPFRLSGTFPEADLVIRPAATGWDCCRGILLESDLGLGPPWPQSLWLVSGSVSSFSFPESELPQDCSPGSEPHELGEAGWFSVSGDTQCTWGMRTGISGEQDRDLYRSGSSGLYPK